MKKYLKTLLIFFQSIGIDWFKLFASLPGYYTYFKNLRKYKRVIASESFGQLPDSAHRFGLPYPIVSEFVSCAGSASGHYFYQDLLVANRIYHRKPQVHFDVGSRVDGFISHLLSFEQKVVLGDVRPLNVKIPNLSYVQLDLTADIKGGQFDRYDSVSCLHALEHMGLGRYGDKINPMGHYMALENLVTMLSESGTLYLSYPTSSVSRIEYNAHRVISIQESLRMFKFFGLSVRQFDYVDDNGDLVLVGDVPRFDWKKDLKLNYGCAIWELVKL